jgi:prepilin-type N-terminal cleavage/methylation domain-containing protein
MKKTANGFTLIEISIVLIVGGILFVSAIEAYQIYDKKQKVENTKSLLSNIDLNLKDFPNTIDPTTADPNTGLGGSLYGRLPCPDADGDGIEDCAMATVRGRRFDGGPNGPNVMIGSLPYTTLGLALDYATDPYGSPIIYAITQSATNPIDFGNGIGAIQITDDDGNQSYTNQYIVVSTGRLGCGGEGADIENCDGDADFIAAFYNDTGAEYYDDRLISHAQVPTVINTDEPAGCEQRDSFTTNAESCPDGWVESEDFRTGRYDFLSKGHYPAVQPAENYNVDPETGDYYFTTFVTPDTVIASPPPRDPRNGGIFGSRICTKEPNTSAKTKCFSEKVTVSTGQTTIVGSGMQNPIDTSNVDKYCPDGWRATTTAVGGYTHKWETGRSGNEDSWTAQEHVVTCSR